MQKGILKSQKKFVFAYINNCSIGGGALELPYSIRLFHRVKIRIGCRDPVLFSFLKWFYVLE